MVSGLEDDETEEIRVHRDESYPLQRNTDPQDNWMDSNDASSHEGMDHNHKSATAILEIHTPSQNSCDERSHASSSPSCKSTPQTNIRPHFLELTLQEVASNNGIEAETLAKLGGPHSSPLRQVVPNGSSELEQKSAGPGQNHHQLHVPSPRNRNSTPQVDRPSSSSAQPAVKDFTYGHRRHHRLSKTSHTDLNDVRWVCRQCHKASLG